MIIFRGDNMKYKTICGLSGKAKKRYPISANIEHVTSIRDIGLFFEQNMFKEFDYDKKCFSLVPTYVFTFVIPHLKVIRAMERKKRYNLDYLKIPIEGLSEIVEDK